MINDEVSKEVKLHNFITDNYASYGKFVNHKRVVPGIDGLKNVHRRILLSIDKVARGKLVGTVKAIGESQSLHPFGDSSIEGVLSDMARTGVIDSQGDFGMKLLENISAAAPRYTKVGLTSQQSKYYFDLLKYAPTHEGEEKIEPEYLINPIPYSLIYGTLCWGIGLCKMTPAFTKESLYEAFKNDDYNLLIPQYGYKMDKSRSELKSLWEDGFGRLCLSFNVSRLDENNIIITGSGETMKPSLAPYKKWVEDGQLEIINESSETICIRLRKVSRARRINMDDVFAKAKSVSSSRYNYKILTVYKGKIKVIGIKKWLTITMGLTGKYFEKSKLDDIKSLEDQVEVLSYVRETAKLLLEERNDTHIRKELGMSKTILDSIKRKSISSLRSIDVDKETKSLKKSIKVTEGKKLSDYIDMMCKNG